ncbi:MAG: hypothetical protein L6R42_010252 [Xanthoria sp. 1 TBL-2021]|nr:MAG: hypothetical protein L6R42_010252 [Xanthoria sp. 1 TBL-2021]
MASTTIKGKEQHGSPGLSIWSRKRDLCYLIFFVIHVPVMFSIDLPALYPPSLTPTLLTTLRTYYHTTYKDQFFSPTGPPTAWFSVFLWMEALYHVPLSLWAVGALYDGTHPLLPVHLLIYAVQTSITTLTCIAEYLSWTHLSVSDKINLGYLYVPYLALSVFMGVDMFGRLQDRLMRV